MVHPHSTSHAPLQEPPHAAQRVVQVRAGGGFTTAAHLGDFGKRQPVEVPQHDDLALLRRQLLDRGGHQAGGLRRHRRFERRRVGGRQPLRLVFGQRQTGGPLRRNAERQWFVAIVNSQARKGLGNR